MAALLTANLCLLLRNCTKRIKTTISGHRQHSIENLHLLLMENLAKY